MPAVVISVCPTTRVSACVSVSYAAVIEIGTINALLAVGISTRVSALVPVRIAAVVKVLTINAFGTISIAGIIALVKSFFQAFGISAVVLLTAVAFYFLR